jgi:hypothetical protein
MCFSASVSFVTAALTGAIGVLSLTRIRKSREVPLASVPLFFALQQVGEGLLWLGLSSAPESTAAADLIFWFLLFAEVFWPVYAPMSIWLIEPSPERRRLMLPCVAIGAGVSGYLLWWLLTRSHSAAILNDHIVYVTEGRHPTLLNAGYLIATSLTPLMSSRRILLALGVVVLAGSVVADVFYRQAFVSVWCFFAAAASVVILWHFARLRPARAGMAGAWSRL